MEWVMGSEKSTRRRSGWLSCLAPGILPFIFHNATPFLLAFCGLAFPLLAHGEDGVFQGVRYKLYRVDPAEKGASRLQVFWRDEAGQPFNTFRNLEAALNAKGLQLRFATNAGIYEPDYIPSGLLVEEGVERAPLNRKPAPALQPGQNTPNFYLKPTGVFYIDETGLAGILETERYATANVKARIATQSGPLLLEEGRIHPKFNAASTSRLLRNGVGIDRDGKVIIVVTERSEAGRINLHGFASLFLSLGCRNALYLDGDISEIYIRGEMAEVGRTTAFAGILAIAEPKK